MSFRSFVTALTFILLLPTDGHAVLRPVRDYIDSKFFRAPADKMFVEAEERLKPHFKKAGVSFPPSSVTFLFIKETRELRLYAGETPTSLKFIHSYPVLAASGHYGPKLKEGDEQVPEGIYRIEGLNPNSQYHLSLRVNYPNEWDRARAKESGRKKLGGDIMIHGNAVSIGCIAIGNVAIEEVYGLARRTAFRKWNVILTPVDFRVKKLPKQDGIPWLAELYARIEKELKALP